MIVYLFLQERRFRISMSYMNSLPFFMEKRCHVLVMPYAKTTQKLQSFVCYCSIRMYPNFSSPQCTYAMYDLLLFAFGGIFCYFVQ